MSSVTLNKTPVSGGAIALAAPRFQEAAMRPARHVQPARSFQHLGQRFKVDFSPNANGHWTLTASSVVYLAPGVIGEAHRCLVMEGEDPDRTYELLKRQSS